MAPYRRLAEQKEPPKNHAEGLEITPTIQHDFSAALFASGGFYEGVEEMEFCVGAPQKRRLPW